MSEHYSALTHHKVTGERKRFTDFKMSLPGLLLGLDQADDVLHPQHQVAHHAEEAELVSGVHQLHPSTLHCLQQVLPGLQDLRRMRQHTAGFRPDRQRLVVFLSGPENFIFIYSTITISEERAAYY